MKAATQKTPRKAKFRGLAQGECEDCEAVLAHLWTRRSLSVSHRYCKGSLSVRLQMRRQDHTHNPPRRSFSYVLLVWDIPETGPSIGYNLSHIQGLTMYGLAIRSDPAARNSAGRGGSMLAWSSSVAPVLVRSGITSNVIHVAPFDRKGR